MPFRLDPQVYGEFRAKIQFTTSAEMPSLIWQACKATGFVSGTVYCQHALAHALARDLEIPVEVILENLPTPRGGASWLQDPALFPGPRKTASVTEDQPGGIVRIGPANTIEEVQ